MRTYKIYVITDQTNGKQYVGRTVLTLKQRFYHHTNSARKPPLRGGCPILHAAIRKRGEENFTIELVEEFYTQEACMVAEMMAIFKMRTLAPNGYNIDPGGDFVFVGPRTSEQRSRLNRDKRGVPLSEDHRAKLSRAAKNRSPELAASKVQAMNAALYARPSKRNTSGYVGVTYDKRRSQWQAGVMRDRKTFRLGRYATAELAAQAVQDFLNQGG